MFLVNRKLIALLVKTSPTSPSLGFSRLASRREWEKIGKISIKEFESYLLHCSTLLFASFVVPVIFNGKHKVF